MTGRTGAGVGMIVTVVMTSLAAVGFFVTTLFLLGEKNDAERRLKETEESMKQVATEGERNNEAARLLMQDAQKGGKSLLGYLTAGMSDLAGKVGGSGGDTLVTLNRKLTDRLAAAKATNLLGALDERDAQVAALTRQVQDATDAQNRANQDLKGALDQVASMRKAQTDAGKVQSASIDEYKAKIDAASADMAKRVKDLNDQIESIRKDAGNERTALNDRIAKLSDEKLVLENKVKQLTSDRGGNLLRPENEEALVDGQVVNVDLDTGNVAINRGRLDKIAVGMTFQVYTASSDVRISDRTGDYVPGKAVIEVIKLEDRAATARVIRAARGNPVAQGDVLVNPLYDPSKKYSFLVFGNFDPDGMGVARPEGAASIRAMIEQYGGTITDKLVGSVDFVVLGERPVLPPQPPSTAPVEVLLAYGDQQKLVKQYDDLSAQAAATSTPILNQNRLFTLMGVGGGALSSGR